MRGDGEEGGKGQEGGLYVFHFSIIFSKKSIPRHQ